MVVARSSTRLTVVSAIGLFGLGCKPAAEGDSEPEPPTPPVETCVSELETLDAAWTELTQPLELLGDAALAAEHTLTTQGNLTLWRSRVVARTSDGTTEWEVFSEPNRPPSVSGVAAAASPSHVLLQGETTITAAPETERGYTWESENTLELFEFESQTWTSYDPATVTDLTIFTSAHWTGSEFLLWGGSNIDPTASGGEYPFDVLHLDPATGALSISTDGPSPFEFIEADLPEHFGGVRDAIWTGEELFVWGITPYHDATFQGFYDPSSREWDFQRDADGPGLRRFANLAGSDDSIFLIGGIEVDSDADYLNEIWSLSLGERTWTQLEVPPHLIVRDGVWAGDQLFVFGDCDEDAVLDLATGTWKSLPSLPLASRGIPLATVDTVFVTQADHTDDPLGTIFALRLGE